MELPGDGHLTMAVRPRWSLGKVKLGCTFDNAAVGGEEREVMLEVRGQDGGDACLLGRGWNCDC